MVRSPRRPATRASGCQSASSGRWYRTPAYITSHQHHITSTHTPMYITSHPWSSITVRQVHPSRRNWVSAAANPRLINERAHTHSCQGTRTAGHPTHWPRPFEHPLNHAPFRPHPRNYTTAALTGFLASIVSVWKEPLGNLRQYGKPSYEL